jgi:carboxylesterase type B
MTQALGDNKNATRILSQFLQVGHRYDEDCLSLNVWTKPQPSSVPKAVLVFFYGGAFFLGSSAAPAYDGARLANENDVVVVTVK